jgi:putative transposase
MKTLYLVTESGPKGTGHTIGRALEASAERAFAITFADRMPAAQDH